MINNLLLSSIKFFIDNGNAVISHMDFTFSNAMTPPAIDDITLTIFNNYTETFKDHTLNNIKLYEVISSTISGCTIKLKPGYELSSTDYVQITIFVTSIFISLKNIFSDGTSIAVTPVKLPDTVGNYRLLFTEINEEDISYKNIFSDIIKIISPIDTAEIPSSDVAYQKVSGDLSVSSINAEDHEGTLVNADFITILEVQITQ